MCRLNLLKLGQKNRSVLVEPPQYSEGYDPTLVALALSLGPREYRSVDIW